MEQQSGCEGMIGKVCLWIGFGLLIVSIVLGGIVLIVGIGG